MNKDYQKLQNILNEASQFFLPKPEKTIFSIGGRGHYENPITDVLAFFLNAQEEHGFGMLFIESLFESLSLEYSPDSFELINAPLREVYTENDKRIDLILEGEHWVMVIENKIYHSPVNPFSEYEQFIENNKQYKKKQAIYVVLSPRGVAAKSNWQSLSYRALLNVLKANLGTSIVDNPYNKWLVILRDFILNLEQYAVSAEMNKEAVAFVENNLRQLFELDELKNAYIRHLKNCGQDILNNRFSHQAFNAPSEHAWPAGLGIAFSSKSWCKGSRMVIRIDAQGEIYFSIYAGNVPKNNTSEIERADQALKLDYIGTPKADSKTVRRYNATMKHKHFDKLAIEQFKEMADVLNAFDLARISEF